MRSRKYFLCWLGVLFVAVLGLQPLVAEAQVRVSEPSKKTLPSFSPPLSSLIQSPVDVPANASIDYTGRAWECQRGYYRSGNQCAFVDMPANAALDYTGHAWECECGYRRVGDACEKITALPKTALYGSSAVQESRVNPQLETDSKEEIRQIQEQLKRAGFDPGPMDGILGPRTMKALRRYLATRQQVLTPLHAGGAETKRAGFNVYPKD